MMGRIIIFQNKNKQKRKKVFKMIFRTISHISKQFSRQIHINKEVVKGSKPGQIVIAHGMLGSLGKINDKISQQMRTK